MNIYAFVVCVILILVECMENVSCKLVLIKLVLIKLVLIKMLSQRSNRNVRADVDVKVFHIM